MADPTNRCPDCDAPLATQEQLETHPEGCECAECSSVCWREWHGDRCLRVEMGVAKQVDWRAEALALRADAYRYRWLKNARGLTLRSSVGTWTGRDGRRFESSHFLQANDTQFDGYETLDELIDVAMSHEVSRG